MSELTKWLASILAGWMMCLAWQAIKKIIEAKLKKHTELNKCESKLNAKGGR